MRLLKEITNTFVRGWIVGQVLGSILIFMVLTVGYFQQGNARSIHGASTNIIPTAAVACNITSGNCTGIGGGSSLFTAATCNGVADDAPAFNSFNAWATGTWQASHTGLIELDIPSGKVCEFISGNVNSNNIGTGLKQFQIVGYGATFGDAGGTGGGFFLGGGGTGVQFNGTISTVLVATVSAGASSITILDTSKCSLWNAGDWAALGGIDPIGGGDPPNPQIFEYVQIASTASCAGSGVLTLASTLSYSYESTWPGYNHGDSLHSDQGGPATLWALNQNWNTTQAYYGLTIAQTGQTNAIGKDIAFRDVTVTGGACIIPSQNIYWRVTNGTLTSCGIEVDKMVSNVVMSNITIHQINFQQAARTNFSCDLCTITSSLIGTAYSTSITNSTLADLQIGATFYGASGSFSGSNTAIASLELTGASVDNIDHRGVWASGTFTVPANMVVSAATNNGGLIRLTVGSTAGWVTGNIGDGPGSGGGACAGIFPVTVIDSTHVDLQGSTFTATCTGQFGSLPLTWAVPRANLYFAWRYSPLAPVLQIADIAVGANNSTVVSFNQNGSPYAGGLPTLPTTSGSPALAAHPAPSWSCVGCTGALNVTDVNSAPASGLPFGSYVSRTLTAANNTASGSIAMPTIGALTEIDMTVTLACSSASNLTFNSPFFQVVGSPTIGSGWNPTVNAANASATPRKITQTTTSGALSGDALASPGVNAWMIGDATAQLAPVYSAVGNCGSASTTITIQTNQGVVP